MADFRRQLAEGAGALGLSLSADCEQGLLDYLALLQKWNRAYNLTAVRDPEAMVNLHLLDSLSIAPFIDRDRYLDVGTGAGLPGIVLALMYPDKQFELLDSNGKKTRFLNQVVAELELDNVRVHHQRVETFQSDSGYQGIISRAFASLADMAGGCGHLLSADGVLLAMKGQYPEQELSQLPKPYIVESCHRLAVPGVDGDRHLLIIGRSSAQTPP